jgi:hypothetical protein
LKGSFGGSGTLLAAVLLHLRHADDEDGVRVFVLDICAQLRAA